MIEICVAFILFCMLLMCSVSGERLSTEEFFLSLLNFFGSCPNTVQRNITRQAIDIRAGKPGTYHKYAHMLASTREGPEYFGAAEQEDLHYFLAVAQAQRVAHAVDGEVLSVEKVS